MADESVVIRAGVKADEGSARRAGEALAAETAAAAEKNGGAVSGRQEYVNALARALDLADRRLAGFRSLAAERMRETVREMRTEIVKGDIGKDMLANLAGGLRSFLAEARRLPPEEFGRMQDELARILSLSDRVAGAVKRAENSKVEFRVDVEGEDAVDELRRRLEAVAQGKAAVAAIRALRDEVAGLTKGEIKELAPILDDIRDRLESGDLGEKNLRAAEKAVQGLSASISKMRPETLEKLGAKAKELAGQLRNTREAARRLPDEMRRGFDLAGLAAQNLGVSMNANTDAIASLVSKLPGVGSTGAAAFAKLSLGVGFAMAGVQKFIQAVVESIRKLRELERASRMNSLDVAVSNVDRMVKRSQNRTEETFKREETDASVAAAAEQSNLSLARAGLEIEQARRRLGVRDSARLFDIGQDEESENLRMELEESEKSLNREIETVKRNRRNMEAQGRDLDGEIRMRQKTAEQIQSYKSEIDRQIQEKDGRAGSFFGELKEEFMAKFGIEEDYKTLGEVSDRLAEMINTQNDAIRDIGHRKRMNVQEGRGLDAEEQNLSRKKELLKRRRELLRAQQETARKAEEARRAEAERSREWELEERDRSIGEDSAEFEREKKNRYATHDQKVAVAREYAAERSGQYDRAAAALDAFMRRIAGKSETQLTDEERSERSRLESRRDDTRRKKVAAERDLWRLEQEGDQRSVQHLLDMGRGANRLVSLGIAGGGDVFGRSIAESSKSTARGVMEICAGMKSLLGEGRRAKRHETFWEATVP